MDYILGVSFICGVLIVAVMCVVRSQARGTAWLDTGWKFRGHNPWEYPGRGVDIVAAQLRSRYDRDPWFSRLQKLESDHNGRRGMNSKAQMETLYRELQEHFEVQPTTATPEEHARQVFQQKLSREQRNASALLREKLRAKQTRRHFVEGDQGFFFKYWFYRLCTDASRYRIIKELVT